MKPRPDSLPSSTYKVDSPLGPCFVTISYQEEEPFETFVVVGKGGSQTAADAEAIGRLISLIFRLENETPEERAREIMGQLKDIGGGAAGPSGKITSMPDAVAIALAMHMGWWEDE